MATGLPHLCQQDAVVVFFYRLNTAYIFSIQGVVVFVFLQHSRSGTFLAHLSSVNCSFFVESKTPYSCIRLLCVASSIVFHICGMASNCSFCLSALSNSTFLSPLHVSKIYNKKPSIIFFNANIQKNRQFLLPRTNIFLFKSIDYQYYF